MKNFTPTKRIENKWDRIENGINYLSSLHKCLVEQGVRESLRATKYRKLCEQYSPHPEKTWHMEEENLVYRKTF